MVEYYLSPSVVYLGDISTENVVFPTESEWVAVARHIFCVVLVIAYDVLCRTSHSLLKVSG